MSRSSHSYNQIHSHIQIHTNENKLKEEQKKTHVDCRTKREDTADLGGGDICDDPEKKENEEEKNEEEEDWEAWRCVHATLVRSVQRARQAIARLKAQRRYWIEEIVYNVQYIDNNNNNKNNNDNNDDDDDDDPTMDSMDREVDDDSCTRIEQQLPQPQQQHSSPDELPVLFLNNQQKKKEEESARNLAKNKKTNNYGFGGVGGGSCKLHTYSVWNRPVPVVVEETLSRRKTAATSATTKTKTVEGQKRVRAKSAGGSIKNTHRKSGVKRKQSFTHHDSSAKSKSCSSSSSSRSRTSPAPLLPSQSPSPAPSSSSTSSQTPAESSLLALANIASTMSSVTIPEGGETAASSDHGSIVGKHSNSRSSQEHHQQLPKQQQTKISLETTNRIAPISASVTAPIVTAPTAPTPATATTNRSRGYTNLHRHASSSSSQYPLVSTYPAHALHAYADNNHHHNTQINNQRIPSFSPHHDQHHHSHLPPYSIYNAPAAFQLEQQLPQPQSQQHQLSQSSSQHPLSLSLPRSLSHQHQHQHFPPPQHFSSTTTQAHHLIVQAPAAHIQAPTTQAAHAHSMAFAPSRNVSAHHRSTTTNTITAINANTNTTTSTTTAPAMTTYASIRDVEIGDDDGDSDSYNDDF